MSQRPISVGDVVRFQGKEWLVRGRVYWPNGVRLLLTAQEGDGWRTESAPVGECELVGEQPGLFSEGE